MTVRYDKGEKDERPWGTWEVLETGEHYVVKKIRVLPGEILSYQVHKHRAEHWIIVGGQGVVTLNDKLINVAANDHMHIAIGDHHRIANPGEEILEFIEVQQGELLDENDIVRLEDTYNRE